MGLESIIGKGNYTLISILSIFLMERYATVNPMNAKDMGIIIILFKENPPVLFATIITIRIEEMIVAGIEYFLMPK